MPCKWWRRILLSIYSRSIQTKRKLFQLVQGSRTPSFFCLVVVERWGSERIHVIYLYENPVKSDCICSNNIFITSIWRVSGEPATISHFFVIIAWFIAYFEYAWHILNVSNHFAPFPPLQHHYSELIYSSHFGIMMKKKTFDSIHGHCIDHISKTKHHKLTEATQHFPFPQLNWCAIDVGLK